MLFIIALMQKVISARLMRELDKETVERYATPSILLMEAAATNAAEVISHRFAEDLSFRHIQIFCGAGNNGGDGAALARTLWRNGAKKVELYLIGDIAKTKGDALINFRIIKHLAATSDKLKFVECHSEAACKKLVRALVTPDIIVDALFGTGLTRPAAGTHLRIVEHINNTRAKRADGKYTNSDINLPSRPFIISLDLPSGLSADSADLIGANVEADLTVTFTAPKIANVMPPAARCNGELVVANVGTPFTLVEAADSHIFVSQTSDAQSWLRRTRYVSGSYKNSHGHALIIAGSKNMSGAAVLCADAAHVAGAGLVTVATPHAAHTSVSTRVTPEIMVAELAQTDDGAVSYAATEVALRLAARATVIALGSGLTSSDDDTRRFIREFVKAAPTPLVLDADALNALAPFNNKTERNHKQPLVLTPHEGEMRRLMNAKTKDALSDRISAAREFAMQHDVILVLKGERTLIASPRGEIFINPTGNAGTGTAGAGDTLTGIITGCLAQEFAREEHRTNSYQQRIETAVQTIIAAVFIAGTAADFAARAKGLRSMSASDIRENLSRAFLHLDSHGESL